MQGAAPLASPGLNPGGTRAGGESRAGGGGLPRLARSTCRRCLRRGGLPFLPPAYPVFSLFSCPLSPQPPSPAGKEEIFSFLMQGAAPLASPGLNPRGTGAGGEPRAGGGVPSESPTRRKTDRTAILLAVPAAKERGDRGRWNYPSQATAAFEMVLSPGADRASAAGGLPSLPSAYPPSVYFPAPYPPSPLPRRGRGRLKVYFAGGSAPGTPALNRLRHLQNLPYKYPAAEIRGSPQNQQNFFTLSSAGSQGEGGPGEMELSVARDGGV